MKVRLYLYLQLAGNFCAKSLELGFFRSEVLGLELLTFKSQSRILKPFTTLYQGCH